MAHVMNNATSRMNVFTFSSIQTEKYALMSRKKGAVQFFRNDYFLHDLIDGKLLFKYPGAFRAHSTLLGEE